MHLLAVIDGRSSATGGLGASSVLLVPLVTGSSAEVILLPAIIIFKEQQDVEILPEALGFLPGAENCKSQLQVPVHLGTLGPLVGVGHATLYVSKQGYYRFLQRPERGLWDRQLLEQLYDCLRVDKENGENYGIQ